MKRLIALSLGFLIAAAPSLAEPAAKTQLVALDGKSVSKMQLRHDFDAAWVIDNQNVLYRDDTRDYYLVTLKQACEPLDIRDRNFAFHPGDSWQLLASRRYQIRPSVGERCDVAKIEQIDNAKANPLRDASAWRVW
jgi:hypothetical protein